MTTIVLSSGHGLYIRGSKYLIDEVTEARRVVDRVAAILKAGGVDVVTFHDDKSKSQATNLSTIVYNHNRHTRVLDVSVHFNAAAYTASARGCEVLFYDAKQKAADVSEAIAKAGGFKNRGAKCRTDLAFLKGTNKPAILLEVCFVDSEADVKAYKANFEAICQAIAQALAKAAGTALQGAQRPTNGKDDVKPMPNKNTLTDTAKADFKALLKDMYNKKIFSVDHSGKVDTMTDGEALGLLISVVKRAA